MNMVRLKLTPDLSIIGLIVLGLLIVPLRYPMNIVEENPDEGTSVRVSREREIEQRLKPTHTWWAGLVLRTNEQPGINQDTPLELTIIDDATGEVVRVTTTTFGQAFRPTTRALRFEWRPIISSRQPYRFRLSAPTLPPDTPLLIRQALPEAAATGQAFALESLHLRLALPLLITTVFTQPAEGEDIAYYRLRGQHITQGINPYACVVDDTCVNRKAPIHLPLFYWLSAASYRLGWEDFSSWLGLWRPIFILSYVGTGVVMFVALYKRGQPYLALLTLLLWLFNRWSLYVIRVVHLDFMAIFFLVSSLLLLRRYPLWSWLALSVSLAFKQVAILLIPLYLISAWQSAPARRPQRLAQCLLIILSIPFITAFPFALEYPLAFTQSILFSATRSSESDFGAPAVTNLLAIDESLGDAALFGLIALVYLVAWRQRFGVVTGGLLVFALFLGFNVVLFNQYFLWLIPFIPLAVSEYQARLAEQKDALKATV
jgi:hypothetical protein